MKNLRLTLFFAAYVIGLISIAILGYRYADYKEALLEHQHELSNRFVTDVSYVELPQMNLQIQSPDHNAAARVKITISLEVEKKNAARVEEYLPRIIDGLATYMDKLDYDELNQPHATMHLRPRFLQVVNSSSNHTPIIDVIFRQFMVYGKFAI